MEITSLSYERMVEDALRGVLRQALEITEAQGLPGAHHFYITFDTTHPGVDIAASLRALHPSEMTIVLQHQFWDLKVLDEHFEITLSFSGVSQRLVIPFAAVTAFADPHAKFGLQFHVEFEEQTDSEDDEDDDAGDPPADDAVGVDSAKVTQRLKAARLAPPGQAAPAAKTAGADDAPGKVVTLDAFRKK
ncbi:MAG: SspB family protein [Rhodospirillaceae bacterium]